MKIWRVPRVGRSTCATAEWWTHDRTARDPQHYVSALAIRAALRRLWSRRRGDDRAVVDRRSDAVAGAKREAGGRWNHYRAAGGSRCGGDEDGRHRRALFLDRSLVLSLPAGAGVAVVRKGDRGG